MTNDCKLARAEENFPRNVSARGAAAENANFLLFINDTEFSLVLVKLRQRISFNK